MLRWLKNPYLVVLVLWLSAIALTYLSSNGLVAAATIFFTGLLPFIFIWLWLAVSNTGISVRSYFSKWHTGILLTWLIFIYSIFAKQWAAALINEIFHIDANSLGITYTLLAALFAPFGLLYQESFLASLWSAFIIVSVCMAGIIPILLILPVAFKKLAKFTLLVFAVAFFSSVFIGITANLSAHKQMLVEKFALWADFNAHHLCSDDWASTAESVVFLGGNRVLAYFPKNPDGRRFMPKTCNFGKNI
ncbi:hypothetical protein [Pseudomonas sp. MWU15-20650]|uniref:hypothetical protein n=1 Tax=Pseudomonas sp. MWU15-20650 TaxID=2933107 RepID=UPI00200D5939|nr:hypothetical protein [Pseudomonas sp. MWU15-20650]